MPAPLHPDPLLSVVQRIRLAVVLRPIVWDVRSQPTRWRHAGSATALIRDLAAEISAVVSDMVATGPPVDTDGPVRRRLEHDRDHITALDLSTPAGRRELAYLAALRWDGSCEVTRDVALRFAETARLTRGANGVWRLWVNTSESVQLDVWESDAPHSDWTIEDAASALRRDFWGIA